MRQYQRLREESRNSRRTIADALEVLREVADFKAGDRARVRIGRLTLPSSKVVGLVVVQFEAARGERVYLVSLPTSVRFRAVRQGSAQPEVFDISRLDGAVVDSAAHVTLADGVAVRAVDVFPARLPYEPSDLDWRIVHQTVAIVGAEEHCYRRWPDGLEFALADKTSDRLVLDCSALYGLNPPPLKVLAHAIAERDPELSDLSLQKLSDSLAMFGIRQIRARTRSG